MQTFTRKERLTSQKIIEQLFNDGDVFKIYPFKILWLKISLNSEYPAQVLITIPKKMYKRAVDRNLLKRRIREAYRKNKDQLYGYLMERQAQLAFAIIYTSPHKVEYKEIEQKIILVLDRLQKEYENSIG